MKHLPLDVDDLVILKAWWCADASCDRTGTLEESHTILDVLLGVIDLEGADRAGRTRSNDRIIITYVYAEQPLSDLCTSSIVILVNLDI